ncbi:MAG: MDR family MFS transporter [Myxococcaceae bacterium]
METAAAPRGSFVLAAILQSLRAATGGMPPTYWWLWSGTLVNKLGSFIVAFLAIYLTGERGYSFEQAGGIVALYGAGSIFASPLGGVLADRIGRKRTMIGGLVLASVAMVFLGFARAPLAVAAGALALGLVNDLFRPAVSAMIADVVPPTDRLRAFSLLYWAINLGFSVSAIAAGMLMRFGYVTLFLADAATSLTFAAIIYVKVPETRPAEAKNAAKDTLGAGLLAPFRDGVFLPFLALTFVVALVFHQFLSALPMEMGARGVSAADYGRVIALNGVMIVLLQPFATLWLAHRSRAAVLAAGAAFTGLGFGFNALATTVPLYAVSVAIWTIGEIVMSPANASVVADLSPPSMRGRYQGAFALSWSFSMLGAPLLGSFVLGSAGRLWLWGGCAALGLLAAAGHLAIAQARRARVVELVGADARPE